LPSLILRDFITLHTYMSIAIQDGGSDMCIRDLEDSERILCKESISYREELRGWLVELGLKRPRRSRGDRGEEYQVNQLSVGVLL